MVAGEVKLLGLSFSAFVTRVSISLRLKKVEYEFVEVELLGQKSEILLQSNPVYKKIPVLIHHGKPICESAIIVQYIDEVWTGEPSLLPTDPFDRAQARFWATYIDDKLPPLIRSMAGTTEEAPIAEEAEKMAQVFQLLEEAFEKCSKGKSFFGGDSIGYLDIVLGSCLGWVMAIEKMKDIKFLDEKKIPLLVEWAERFLQDNAVKGVMPKVEEHIAFTNMRSAAYSARLNAAASR